jgi:hypothetical protein
VFTLSTDCAFANWSLVDEEERRPPSRRFDVCLVDRLVGWASVQECHPTGVTLPSVIAIRDQRPFDAEDANFVVWEVDSEADALQRLRAAGFDAEIVADA